jgi:hypothetical protein
MLAELSEQELAFEYSTVPPVTDDMKQEPKDKTRGFAAPLKRLGARAPQWKSEKYEMATAL